MQVNEQHPWNIRNAVLDTTEIPRKDEDNLCQWEEFLSPKGACAHISVTLASRGSKLRVNIEFLAFLASNYFSKETCFFRQSCREVSIVNFLKAPCVITCWRGFAWHVVYLYSSDCIRNQLSFPASRAILRMWKTQWNTSFRLQKCRSWKGTFIAHRDLWNWIVLLDTLTCFQGWLKLMRMKRHVRARIWSWKRPTCELTVPFSCGSCCQWSAYMQVTSVLLWFRK